MPELPRQLTFTTSSLKKRKISRQTTRDPDLINSRDSVLPSTEADADADADPAFSFSAAPATSDGRITPVYLRSDSLPPSGLPSRLQTQFSDCISSGASSPVAASTDLSVDNDRVEEIFDSDSNLRLSAVSRHVAMGGGAAEYPLRSSSPLKRRASSMDTETESDDVEMISLALEGDENVEGASDTGRQESQAVASGTLELPLKDGTLQRLPYTSVAVF